MKSKPLLVIKLPGHFSVDQVERLHQELLPVADSLQAEVLLISEDCDATLTPGGLGDLVTALNSQTGALASLANSNAMLAQAIMAQVDDEEQPQTQYLDGSKRKATNAPV